MKKLLCVLMFGMVFGQAELTTRMYTIDVDGYECEDYNTQNGTDYNCACNENTWQEYYDSANNNMEYCWLRQAHLVFANLTGADLRHSDLTETHFYGANLCNLISSSYDVCEESVADINDDGYDDISYEAGATSGDLNLDGVDNVLDVVTLVNQILNPLCISI